MEDNTSEPTTKKEPRPYLTPLAIIIAGGMIAAAILLNKAQPETTPETVKQAPPAEEQAGSTDKITPVTEKDHIRGNPDAPIKIVEYSDFECPFCKKVHATLNQLMEKYESSGEVAWIYRHFPLIQLHPKNAMKVAIASECAAEQGGDEMFWKFADAFFAITPANDRTDLASVLPKIYSDIGVDAVRMDSCVASGRYDDHIQEEIENAIATGGRGTPWSILVARNGKTFPVNGAQPLATWEQLINLAKKEE